MEPAPASPAGERKQAPIPSAEATASGASNDLGQLQIGLSSIFRTHAAVLQLQRSVGNAATRVLLQREATVRATLVQRQPTDQRTKIQDALAHHDWFLLDAIDDLSQATDEEKVTLSGIAIGSGYYNPEKATAKVAQLWTLMGDRMPNVAAAHPAAWQDAYNFSPGIRSMKVVTDGKAAFTANLRSVADSNLSQNRDFVNNRMKELGIDGPSSLTPEELTSIRRNVQAMAWHGFELRQEQQKYRKMVVGYGSQDLGFGEDEWHFDPGAPPKYARTMFSTPPHRHADVLQAWMTAEDEVASMGNQYPELYGAAMSDEDGIALRDLSRVTPEAFGEHAKQLLVTLRDRIADVQNKIDDGSVDLLDLGLLVEAVKQGAGSTGHNWSAGFDALLAKQVITDHANNKAAIQALFKTVEVAALVASVFTGGLGRLVAAGVAVGADAFMAGKAAAEASQLEQASKATPLMDKALVSRVQADARKAEATALMVQAMTNALMVAVPGAAAALQDARLAVLVPDAAQLARLRSLAKADDVALEKLLTTADNPQVVEDLLTKTGSVADAQRILETRAAFTQRFAERYSKDIANIRALKAEVPELAGIADEELVALRGYTAEDYDTINRALRSQSADQELAHLQPYIDTLKSGLENFPEFKGVVTRTESGTQMMYTQGEVVTKEAFTSTCGPGGKVTKQIMGNTTLEIESISGRDIRAIAAHPAEAEVLFPPGSKFQVVSKTQPVPGWYKIKLRQVE